MDKKVFRVQTDRVNEEMKHLKIKSIAETNNLTSAATTWMAERIGLKKAEHRKKNERRWKRRIEGDIKKLRQEVDFMEREVKGELGLKKRRKVSELNKKIQSEKKTIENCD